MSQPSCPKNYRVAPQPQYPQAIRVTRQCPGLTNSSGQKTTYRVVQGQHNQIPQRICIPQASTNTLVQSKKVYGTVQPNYSKQVPLSGYVPLPKQSNSSKPMAPQNNLKSSSKASQPSFGSSNANPFTKPSNRPSANNQALPKTKALPKPPLPLAPEGKNNPKPIEGDKTNIVEPKNQDKPPVTLSEKDIEPKAATEPTENKTANQPKEVDSLDELFKPQADTEGINKKAPDLFMEPSKDINDLGIFNTETKNDKGQAIPNSGKEAQPLNLDLDQSKKSNIDDLFEVEKANNTNKINPAPDKNELNDDTQVSAIPSGGFRVKTSSGEYNFNSDLSPNKSSQFKIENQETKRIKDDFGIPITEVSSQIKNGNDETISLIERKDFLDKPVGHRVEIKTKDKLLTINTLKEQDKNTGYSIREEQKDEYTTKFFNLENKPLGEITQSSKDIGKTSPNGIKLKNGYIFTDGKDGYSLQTPNGVYKFDRALNLKNSEKYETNEIKKELEGDITIRDRHQKETTIKNNGNTEFKVLNLSDFGFDKGRNKIIIGPENNQSVIEIANQYSHKGCYEIQEPISEGSPIQLTRIYSSKDNQLVKSELPGE